MPTQFGSNRNRLMFYPQQPQPQQENMGSQLGNLLSDVLRGGAQGYLAGTESRNIQKQEKEQQEEKESIRLAKIKLLQSSGYSPEESEELSVFDNNTVTNLAKNRGVQQEEIRSFERKQQEEQELQQKEEKDLNSKMLLLQKSGYSPEEAEQLSGFDNKTVINLAKDRETDQRSTDKMLFSFKKEVFAEGRAGEKMIKTANQLKAIANRGNMSSPEWVSLLKTLGLGNIKQLQTADTQTYNKILGNFLDSMKGIFGSNVTNLEAKSFMDRLATADTSKESRDEILNEIINIGKASKARASVMKRILKQEGRTPKDLMERLEDEWQQELENFSDNISFVSKKKDEIAQDLQRETDNATGMNIDRVTDESMDRGQKIPPEDEEEEVDQGQESTTGYLGRQLARGGARAAESILGLPGDLALALQRLVGKGLESSIFLPEVQSVGKALGEKQYSPIQTTEQIKEKVTKPIEENLLPKGYLEPSTPTEKFIDDVVSDFSTALIPVKGKIPFGRAAASAILGNTAQRVADEIGSSKGTQAAVKAVGMTLPYVLGPKGLMNKAIESYKDVEIAAKNAANNMPVSSSKIQNAIGSLKKTIRTGGVTEGKDILANVAEKIERAVKGEKTNLKNLWKIYKDNNQLYKNNAGLADVTRELPKINNAIRDIMIDNTSKYPKFVEPALEATNIWKGIHSAGDTVKFIQKATSPNLLKSKTAKILVGYNPLAAAKYASAAIPVNKIVSTMSILSSSPSAQKVFAKALAEAQARNAPALVKSIKKLDDIALKEESKKGSKK